MRKNAKLPKVLGKKIQKRRKEMGLTQEDVAYKVSVWADDNVKWATMETGKVAKQMVGFQKTVVENSFNAMNIVQDQTENMLNNVIGQNPWVTEEGKKQINETFAYTKKARNDFKKAIDEGYAQFEKLFDQK